jgi:hypothetical protein
MSHKRREFELRHFDNFGKLGARWAAGRDAKVVCIGSLILICCGVLLDSGRFVCVIRSEDSQGCVNLNASKTSQN